MFSGKLSFVGLIAPIAMAAAFGIGISSAAQSGRDRLHPSPGIFSYSFPGAIHIDVTHETVTLPLHKGVTRDGRTLWYVITDSSNQADAKRRGVNYSNKMLNALRTKAVQKAQFNDDDPLIFEGTVDFSPTEILVPGPNGFPPAEFAPGARGDAKYSPLIHIVKAGDGDRDGDDRSSKKGLVLNAPQVANDTGRSGSVVAIDYERRTVTLNMLGGWVDGQFNLYLHTDSSSELVAALEHSTYAPNLNAAPGHRE